MRPRRGRKIIAPVPPGVYCDFIGNTTPAGLKKLRAQGSERRDSSAVPSTDRYVFLPPTPARCTACPPIPILSGLTKAGTGLRAWCRLRQY